MSRTKIVLIFVVSLFLIKTVATMGSSSMDKLDSCSTLQMQLERQIPGHEWAQRRHLYLAQQGCAVDANGNYYKWSAY